jgi:hypothetical protein
MKKINKEREYTIEYVHCVNGLFDVINRFIDLNRPIENIFIIYQKFDYNLLS